MKITPPLATTPIVRAISMAFLIGIAPVWAQQPPAPAPAPAAAAPAAAPAAAKPAVSQQELDQLLAPIALYPDSLIAQILMAATYPLEVVEAARWSAANPSVKDKVLEDAMQKQSWDPAVKALTSVPQVLKQMNENLSWTQKLGDAFLADQKAVLASVQSLRAKAQAAGNLKSTPEQTVKAEQQAGQTVYIIESPKPETVYVPTYNPATIYGPWPYPAPPYYMYPPAYVYPPGLAFATGVFVGAAIWGNCNWGGNNVNVNVNKYNNFNRSNISNNNFQHNTEHRKGVNYSNQAAADKFNRGGNAQAAQSRDQFRGRAEQGRSEMSSMGRGEMDSRVQQADRAGGRDAGGRDAGGRSPSAGSMDAGGRGGGGFSGGGSPGASRDFGGGGGGGFSGAGAGAATRDASSRGSASRSSMSTGGGGGRR